MVTQKDLGVTISQDLKPGHHIAQVVKKANQRIGMIRRCFTDLTEKKVCILYKAIVRPLMEYGAPAWSPWHKKDIESLEKVQKRCLKLVRGKTVELESLESRRRKTDLVETYKMLNGLYKNNSDKFFSFPQRTLRGHHLKLTKRYARTDIKKFFFSNRVVDDWNSLPEEAINAKTVPAFKRSLSSLPMD